MPRLVLIVDDDPVQRRLAEAAVTKAGYHALCVEDGASGLAVMEAGEGRDIAVIVQTSRGSIDMAVQAMRAGAFDCAVKPVAPAHQHQSALKVTAAEDTDNEAGQLQILDAGGEIRALADMEEEIIRLAIGHYNGQMSEVARRLGIGRSTLYRKLKELGIDPELQRPSSGVSNLRLWSGMPASMG